MDSILSVISAIFALPAEVLLDAQWTQSDNWLSYFASSALALAGAACGACATAADEVVLTLRLLTLVMRWTLGARCMAYRLTAKPA